MITADLNRVPLLWSLSQNLREGILIENDKRSLVIVNQGFCTLFKIEVDPIELRGMNCAEAAELSKHLFVDSDRFIARINEIVTNQRNVLGEVLHLVDGTILERDYIPVYRQQQVYGHVWIYRDITDRERMIQRISEQANILQALTATALDAVIQIDEHGTIIEFNPAAESMFGFKKQEVLGQNMHNLITPDRYRESQRVGMEHFRRTGEGVALNQRLELTAKRRSGEEFAVELTAFATATDSGFIVTGFLRDLTERNRARALALKQGETASAVSLAATRLLEAENINDVMPSLLKIIGEAFQADRVHIFNHHEIEGTLYGGVTLAYEWLADHVKDPWKRDQLIARPWDDVFLRWYHEFRRGNAIWGHTSDLPPGESAMLQASGIRSMAVVPIFSGSELWGTLGFDIYSDDALWTETDVSAAYTLASTIGAAVRREQLTMELRASQETLQRQLNELATTSRELENATAMIVSREKVATLGVIAGSIAHEINSPLGAILNSAERLLESSGLTEDQITNLRLIERAAVRSRNVIGKLLATTRQTFDDGGASNVAAVVSDLLELYEGQIILHGIKIIARQIDNVDVAIGYTELSQILTNLLGNAKDALLAASGKRDHVITISTKTYGSCVDIRVHDTGDHVPKDVIDKAFDPFYTTKPIGQGTGIGLWISRRLVQAAKGKINIASTRTGTTVTVCIPRAEAA